MKFLVDTHAWLWFLESPEKFSRRTLNLMEDAQNTVFVSVVSIWEIVLKASVGKLRLPQAPDQYIRRRMEEENFTELPIESHHALTLYSIPLHHRDPFDRLLVAQATYEKIPILSADEVFQKYSVKTMPL